MSESKKDYRVIAAEKKLQQNGKIPKEWLLSLKEYEGSSNFMDVPTTCGILNDVECKITSEYDATALLEKLKTGDLSAEQTMVAFCKRAAIAHQLVCELKLRLVHIMDMQQRTDCCNSVIA
jgi:amidase